MIASAVGVLGLILRKARCFIRRVGGSYDYAVGFCDGTITPEISRSVNPECESRHYPPSPGEMSYATVFLETGTKVAVAAKSGIELAQTVLPYIEPLLLTAAL